jgi:uncharacterized membrane protein YdcZ (DUF606 family)
MRVGILAAGLVGQLTASVIIDKYGLLGLERTAISTSRVIGLALVAPVVAGHAEPWLQ